MKHVGLIMLLGVSALAAEDDTRTRVMRLLPATTYEGPAPTEKPANAAQHTAALKADEEINQAFWVTSVVGKPEATHVVFLVPQFHRSPLLPLLWSSLGEAIAGVQQNIDYVTTRLIQAHGLTCIGTEGSWAPNIPRSEEQATLANVTTEMDRAVAALQKANPELGSVASNVAQVLLPFLKRQALTLDGVGSALWRLSNSNVKRFGLEDEKLNQDSLKLLAKMRVLEEEIARLNPEEQAAVEDAMGIMWKTEYPAFEKSVATPLIEAFAQLDKARAQALHDDVEADAQVIARFVKIAKTLTDEVVRVEDVKSYADYYRDVGKPTADEKPHKKPTAAQKKKAEALARKLAPLQAQYEKLAGEKREHAAVAKLLARLKTQPSCAMVFGANHEEGLLKALKAQAGADVAVIVVQPFPPDEE